MVGAKPQRPGSILMNSPHIKVMRSKWDMPGEVYELPVLEVAEAAHRSKPEPVLAILEDGHDVVKLKAVFLSISCEAPVFKAVQSLSTHPNHTLRVLIDRIDDIPGQTIL